MSPKKVLFLDHSTGIGGAERSLLLILEHLDRSRWQPVLGCRQGSLSESGRELSIEVVSIRMPRLRRFLSSVADWFAGAREIAALVSEREIKGIYSNTVRASVYASLAAAQLAVPFVWHMRDFWLTENAPMISGLDRFGKILIGTTADLIMTNSHAVAHQLPFRDKIRVVHNGIDLGRFTPKTDREKCRSLYGIPKDAQVIGAVGRLRPWKGFEWALRITARIRSRDSRVYLLLVGGTPLVSDGYAKSLFCLAEELKIADRVVFTGHLGDVRPALIAMDVFVHAGEPEPFGLVNVEAMAMHLPLVAFAHGALPEIVIHGETGILVPPRDESKLTAAVLQLMNSPEQRARMGRAGRKRVETFFSVERMVDEVSRNLSQIMT